MWLFLSFVLVVANNLSKQSVIAFTIPSRLQSAYYSGARPAFKSRRRISHTQLRAIATEGDVVTIEYSLSLPESNAGTQNDPVGDFLFDTGKVTFVLGMGNYLPGLHENVQGMTVGGSLEGAQIDAGFGPRDEENLIVKIPPENLPDEMKKGIQLGSKLFLQNGAPVTVIEVADDGGITIDANHPLAGKKISFGRFASRGNQTVHFKIIILR
mmetsp:Transcript_29783/g.68345  ORF Transcript_29783/g.68345 Transcript_29783/m.68345 type:complete len:212 (+) Transcript_29783:72-707(+)